MFWPRTLALLTICCGPASACSMSPTSFGDGTKRIFTPSSMVAPTTIDVARLAKVDDCASCHADVASHWMHSVHAYASFDNPWYRASVDEFREERGKRESRFCAGCHDPLLLISGDIDAEVEPDNELAYAGITCLVCHSVESARPDGNGSFALTDRPVLIPDPAVPEEIEAHRARLAMPALRSAELCGSCHRSSVGPAMGNSSHLRGIDDLGDWQTSAFAGAFPDYLVEGEPQTCRGCHMSDEAALLGDLAATRGEVHGHRWAASHTAMLAQMPDATMARDASSSLKGSVVLDVGRTRVGNRSFVLPEEAEITEGAELVFDVVIENAKPGHRFPGGTRDMHDVWLEVELLDARGRLIAASRRSGSGDGEVFVLRSTVLDEAADPELLHRVHRFSTVAFDRTIQASGVQLVRYETTLPPELTLPLRIEVRVLHRKHRLELQRVACAATATERGKAFAEHARIAGKIPLDPCSEQPTTTVAESTTWLGADDPPSLDGNDMESVRTTAERLLAQARGLLEDTQEHAFRARPVLRRAVEEAKRTGSASDLARAHLLLARLAATEGRADEAVEWTDCVQEAVGAHPVLDRVRGNALARVWRWSEAAEAYERLVAASPRDPSAWRALANAYGSLGLDEQAQQAAEAWLRLRPRDEELLRTRALALASLGDPEAASAERTWLRHRSPDEGPAALARCERKHVRCRTDRQPIPLYALRKPLGKVIHASIDPR